MNTYKKWNICLSIVTSFIACGIWLYWEYVCTQNGCLREIREFVLRPLLWSAFPLAVISTSLLVFPSKLFKQWLAHVASWNIPLSIYFVLEQDPRQSGPLGIDRIDLVWGFGSILLFITIIYAVGWHLYEWRKKRIPGTEMLKLSIFLVPLALFYTIWQLF